MVEVRDLFKTKSADTTDYTSRTTYDLNHQPLTVKDAEGNTTSTACDADGLTLSTTNAAGHTAYTSYDERGAQIETKTPWTGTGDSTVYRTTRYEYDEVGNTTRVTTPRGAQTANADDFVARTTYDELNRPVRSYQPYDPTDARYNDPNVYTETTYDAAGRAIKTSLPPSDGQTVRNDTTVEYYANGWIKSSTDAWGIKTRYEYDDLGAQTARTLTSADGSASRTMTWAYYPDGKLKAKSDDGVPVGSHSVVTDDDTNGLYTATGTWTKTSATGQQGTSHRTHAAATGSTDKFTWTLDVPADGSYTLSAAWPQVSGAATDAKFTLNHGDGAGTDVNFTANQTTGAAAWNTLGKVTLTTGEKVTVALAPSGTGTVVADAVRLVRDNGADTDAEDKAFAYAYDLNGNLIDITDTSRGTAKNADAYAMTYDGLNQIKSVREDLAGSPAATTSYTYNNLGKPLTVTHPDQASDYVYNDPRNLLTKVTVDDLNDTKAAKVTSYTYDVLGRQKTITKGNGNVTTNAFQADGALKSMREETSAGALVASHAYTYDANGNQLEDVASKRNADDASATLDSTTTYVYDPVDRLSRKTKTGHGASTETHVHDANANVIQQTVGGTSTSFNYDRNRLLSSTVDGQTASYRYDPFGRQTSVVGGGKTISRTTYDGFDHIKVAEQANDAGVLEATRYTYDPLDRTASKTTSGTDGKTTDYTYLGLSQEVLGEEVAGELTKSYQYSPWGQRLSQVSYKADAEAGIEAGETGYYGHNAHSDVETMTDDAGKTVATYGYTAYGENDDAEFTGIDKPDAANPEQPSDESFNAYRFNGKRWDAGSATYDMGFRDYAPGLNTFTTRDMYNGALADMGLGADPFTGSRYAFASGNPISGIELDGHVAIDGDGNPIFPSEQNSNPGASRPRAHAPAVDNSDLDNLLKKIYGREFVADEDLFGDGKVSTAIIDEYNTGKPRGSWHVEKGSALLTGIAKLLAKDRNARQKTGNGILSDADLKIAKAEAGELWNALNSNDVTGNVTAHVRSSPETLKAITSNREFVLKSEPLSSVTGQKFASGPHPKAPVRPVGEPANLRGGYKAFGIAAPLLTVASTPGYVRDYGLWGGMQEMFLDSIDPFGWRYDNPTVPKPIPPA